MDDVVVIDPSDSCPVGFNPLAFPGYENPPLIADAVLSVLKELWADNWGVRIQDVLSARTVDTGGGGRNVATVAPGFPHR